MRTAAEAREHALEERQLVGDRALERVALEEREVAALVALHLQARGARGGDDRGRAASPCRPCRPGRATGRVGGPADRAVYPDHQGDPGGDPFSHSRPVDGLVARRGRRAGSSRRPARAARRSQPVRWAATQPWPRVAQPGGRQLREVGRPGGLSARNPSANGFMVIAPARSSRSAAIVMTCPPPSE